MKSNFSAMLLLVLSSCLYAQEDQPRKWELGLLLAVDQNQTEYTLSDWVFQGIEEIKNLDTKVGLGFSAGISLEYRLSKNTSLRFSPLYSTQNNSLIFVDQDDNEISFGIHPRTLGFPLHFMYAPRGREKIPYFFIGPRVQTQIGDRLDPAMFSVGKTNIAAEFGLGFTIYSKIFSFSPQLSYSQGLSNLKEVGESGFYNNAIRTIRSDRLSLAVIIGLAKK